MTAFKDWIEVRVDALAAEFDKPMATAFVVAEFGVRFAGGIGIDTSGAPFDGAGQPYRQTGRATRSERMVKAAPP